MQTCSPITYRRRLLPLLIIALVTIGCVIAAIWTVWAMDLKWALFIILGLLFPFTLIIVKNIRRFIMGLLIFSIPLNADYNILYHPSPGGADAYTIGLSEILLLFLLGLTLFRAVSERKQKIFAFFLAITWPALALFMFYCLSMLNATDLLWSSFDIFNLVKAIAFFLVVANNINSKEDIALILTALFLGLLFQAVIVGLQAALGTTSLSMLGLGESNKVLAFEMETANVARPGGTVGHCNHLARYIGFILPVSIIIAMTERARAMRWFAAIVTAAGLVALIYTLTRSSWLGLLISVLFMIPFMFRWRLISFRVLGKFMLAAIVFILILLAFSDVIRGRLTTYDLGSAHTRITTAQVALNIIQDHPLIGAGINNYGALLEEYWDGEDAFTRKAAVHNTYLLYMAEIGIPGFIVYMVLLIVFFFRTKKAMRSRFGYYSAVAIGIMGSLAGFFFSAFADKSYKENFTLILVFFTLAAVVEGINHLNKQIEQGSLEYIMNRHQA